MQRIVLVLVGTLAVHSGVQAQGSTLRIACQGQDIGAEVSINGQFKGECPLEAQVRAGTVKLRLVKKVDALREQVFEQDIRLGDGVVKQIDVVLSAPRRIAGGQERENTSQAAAPAESAKVAQVGNIASPQGLIPPRPRIPLAISEDVWKIIEASEAYRNLPRPRAAKVVYRGTIESEPTGSKVRSLPKSAPFTMDSSAEITAVGDRCTMTQSLTATGITSNSYNSYACGFISLGSTSNGNPTQFVESIDELKGSLFPMRIGARLTMRSLLANVLDRKNDAKQSLDCEVISQLAAREVDPSLAGTAWKVRCKTSYIANVVNTTGENDDYYLEDLGTMLSTIGKLDGLRKTYVLPTPGTETQMTVGGDFGSRYTTTYASYDVTVDGNNVSARAASPSVTASLNAGRPATTRNEPVQPELPQRAASAAEESLEQQLKAAAAGNASAMASLGARYEAGKGVAQSFEQAALWYRKAAEAGDRAGMAGLGSMYLNGTGLQKDPEQARIWFTKAAEAGNGRGMNGIGVLYIRGDGGLPKDSAQAIVWYRKAAEAGEGRAMTNLGRNYVAGRGVARDEVEAVSWFRKAADAGSADGMQLLGAMYANGQGIAKNEIEAAAWLRKAADAGSADGMYSLGIMYENGRGVAKNEVEAVSWYRKAAAAGSADAMNELGLNYASGQGVAKDDVEAASWYRKAAAAGDADGMYNLGALYANGRGVAKNEVEAASWYRKAAAAGNANGMYQLGIQYENGRGIAKNEVEAVSWYRKAADAGNAAAMAKLAWRYETGNGVTKDLVQATTWYRKSAEAGDIAGMAGYGEMLFIGTGTSYSSKDQARIWWSKAADAGNGRALNGMGRLYFYGSGGLAQSTERAIVSFEKAVEAGEPAGRTNIATLLEHYPSARGFLKNQNILQARPHSPANATNATPAERQAAQPAQRSASSGSGFFGAMLGGAISTIVDRNAAVMNSAISSSGGVAAGALTSANTALARETKEQIAQGMGGNGSMEGMAGMAVGSALASGSTAGAVAAFSGAASNPAAAGSSGSGGSDNWSGVRNEISGLMNQSRTAGNASARSLAGAGAVVGSCSTAASGSFGDQLQGRFNKYKNDGQCGPIVQSAEAMRVRAIANCKAGDTRSADIIYGTQYLRQMIPYVKSACP